MTGDGGLADSTVAKTLLFVANTFLITCWDSPICFSGRVKAILVNYYQIFWINKRRHSGLKGYLNITRMFRYKELCSSSRYIKQPENWQSPGYSLMNMQVQVGRDFDYGAEVTTYTVIHAKPWLEYSATTLDEQSSKVLNVPTLRYLDSSSNFCQKATTSLGTFSLGHNFFTETSNGSDQSSPDAVEVAQNLADETAIFTLLSQFSSSQEMANEPQSMFGSVTPEWMRVRRFVMGFIAKLPSGTSKLCPYPLRSTIP